MDVKSDVDRLEISSYEEVRRQKMLENQKLLEELGLAKNIDFSPSKNLPPPPKNFPAVKRSAPKYNGSKANKKAALMTTGRSSRRLKGEAPDDTLELDDFLINRTEFNEATVNKNWKT
ncbi:unnamed protein product [Absidia cylindrospora]